MQVLWKIIYQFPPKIILWYDPAIPLLGIYLKETKTLTWKDTYSPMSIAVLFIRVKTLRQPKYTLRWKMKKSLKSINYISSDMCSIGVFPEGTRSRDLTLLDFKAGCFKIATKTKCPILVVALSGTENIHKKWWTRNVKVNVDILEVLTAADYENKKTTEISDSIYSLMKSHLDLNSK